MSAVMEVTKKRVMEIVTPLGEDVLRFSSMQASEGMSQLFDYQIELQSAYPNIDLNGIMGKPVTVKLELPTGGTRFFNGYVTRFAQSGTVGSYYRYRATVQPWLWFLTRRSNCRIFQNETVRQIIEKIFRDHNATADVKFELSGNYAAWEYCVQYRESDFNFVSRLMEQEGIYYYFKHEDKKHTLIIADSYTAHAPVEGYEQIPFIPTGSSTRPKYEHFSNWSYEREIQPGRYVADDYNFETPSVEMQSQTQFPREHAQAGYEIYDYPGEFENNGEGEQHVKTRIEEVQARFEVIQGQGNARGLCVGALFDLTGHSRVDQNTEYLVTGAEYLLSYSQYEAQQSGGATYNCSFTAINSKQQYRAPSVSKKTTVQGPQTAVVVGPAGDEIYTDKYGRVKVQFHWDREGKHNEDSSCWIRVSHPWAGKNWGAISIPRIGQEVIVEFLEGDPDRPIITGRVYNAEQMPPWDLPANATQSGILSRSSKGAGPPNANAIRMEDKKGEEQLWFHAEKDQLTEVEHDEDKWVGNDRRKTIDGNETTTVHKNRTETVDLNETISVGINRTEQVGVNETIAIGANRSVTIGANKSETVALAKAETIGLAKALTIGAGYQTSVGGAMNTTVGLFKAEQVGLYKTNMVGKDFNIKVGASYVLQATDDITLRVGKSELVMKADGTITVNGVNISTFASNETQIIAKSDITIKGKNILEN